jgi:hypothetical protein
VKPVELPNRSKTNRISESLWLCSHQITFITIIFELFRNKILRRWIAPNRTVIWSNRNFSQSFLVVVTLLKSNNLGFFIRYSASRLFLRNSAFYPDPHLRNPLPESAFYPHLRNPLPESAYGIRIPVPRFIPTLDVSLFSRTVVERCFLPMTYI